MIFEVGGCSDICGAQETLLNQIQLILMLVMEGETGFETLKICLKILQRQTVVADTVAFICR
jgi:hypothetical protein